MEKIINKEIPGQHEKISYTAIGVAYARSFTDIPYSKDISEICDAGNLTPENKEIHEKMSPYFEGRYKGLTNLLLQSGCKNILELASGVSPRGLILTQDPKINYTEADLPDMLKQKKWLLEKLSQETKIEIPKNLHLTELNVLDDVSFTNVIDNIPEGPVAIGNEGLMAYFDHEEKRKMAEIIHSILSKRSGVWITPDIFTLEDMEKLNTGGKRKEALEEIKKRTGRDYRANAFSDIEQARNFFEELGFSVRIQNLKDTAGNIVSAKIGLDPDSVEKQLTWPIWELRVVNT